MPVAPLLERDTELRVLDAALERAAEGAGSVVLVSGEAGIGKTSLVRAFTRSARAGRVLAGACDDLLTPRALGPLRDAVRRVPGPLATALTADDPGEVFPAVLDELTDPRGPTVLVVEDLHWADSATLDLLRHVGRRVDDLPAMLLLTYRADEIGREHPLQGVLGNLGGRAVRRLPLGRLSAGAVAELATGSPVDPQRLHRATAGNPFFVTEALASSDEAVPRTVVDAVLARVHRLGPAAREAVEQLAIVPSRVERALLGALCDLRAVAEAERIGVLEVRPDAVAFRHELARRAVAESLPVSVRLELNARVTAALLATPAPDLARVLHHAVEAGDDAAVVRYGPSAAREASRAGAHRQAVAAYEHVLSRAALLDPAEHVALLDAHAWSLYNVNRLHDAAAAAGSAVALAGGLGAPALVPSLMTLSRQQWLLRRTADALASARRADDLASVSVADPAVRAAARINLGAVLVLVDREREALPYLTAGDGSGIEGAGPEQAALARNYHGSALLQLGDPAGCTELVDSVVAARELGQHEYVMRGYYNLAEGLWRLGRFADAARYLDAAAEYGRDRDFQAHSYFVEARRQRLASMRGEWAPAEEALRALLAQRADPGMLGRESMPALARLLVRRGADDAPRALAAADRAAREADVLEWLVPTGLAHLEHAWLTASPAAAGDWGALLRARTDRPGAAHFRGEVLRWLRRLGEPVASFPGCPPEFASGIDGDWRASAAAWAEVGDPYERALELLESGEVGPTVEALSVFDALGARPVAGWARRRLRELGVTAVPRGPAPATRANPAGLTERQAEILRLLAAGLTNAEIAARLVVSVRTVDHHVSAVLQKLGVATRREAAAAAAGLVG